MGNITSLEKFDNGTLADTPPLNRNFETIRSAINDNDARISNLNNKKAEDGAVVHLAGNETINGIKTFIDLVKFSGGVDIGMPIISSFSYDSTGFKIKLSNNFVIQGGTGQILSNNYENILTLKEHMADTNYFCFISSGSASYSSSSDYGTCGIKPNDISSVIVSFGRNKSFPTPYFWLVFGMAKEQ